MPLLGAAYATAAFFLLSVLSLAMADMSIIEYDHEHPAKFKSDEETMAIFKSWMTKHEKVYDGVEETMKRFNIFKDNMRFVDEHNSVDRPYKVGLNIFADMSDEEYESKLGTRIDSEPPSVESKIATQIYEASFSNNILPQSVDWRSKGAVGPIRNQGNCGGCWAFSAVAAIEGINKIVTGKLLDLSEQELIDCDRKYSHGCVNGHIHYALDFVTKNGINSEAAYPFVEVQNTCDKTKMTNKVVTINARGNVQQRNESALKVAVARQPISIGIESKGKAFKLYTSGTFVGLCGTQLDHAVVLVGYGTDQNKVDYWILRNTWGTNWGENGYMKIQRNLLPEGFLGSGKCGLASFPYYPIKY